VFVVYKITNLQSGRYYIGVHKTNNPDDDYFGSGVEIREAVEQLGRDAFKKEIVQTFEHECDAFKLEAQLVTLELIHSGKLYNRMVGGKGGWDHIPREVNLKNLSNARAKLATLKTNPEKRLEINQLVSTALKKLYRTSPAFKAKFTRFHPSKTLWVGRRHSAETKVKMSVAKKGIQTTGTLGTVFVFSILKRESRRIKKDELSDYFAAGWSRGRKMSF
jgi:hypothetical protein